MFKINELKKKKKERFKKECQNQLTIGFIVLWQRSSAMGNDFWSTISYYISLYYKPSINLFLYRINKG